MRAASPDPAGGFPDLGAGLTVFLAKSARTIGHLFFKWACIPQLKFFLPLFPVPRSLFPVPCSLFPDQRSCQPL